ncbi:polyketide cyclase dehydrase protein [Colletotrichum incanum]|uniref:Polyketide cyclase dehydrase protein n=1 Tax=Colletotrichum incanum TaxID=1573173 RepID=A0A167DA06_COLIC|nr:polyketide cyclase dehydrase protein [Colletotrichum incanum]OHW97645.1 polyketide cyclase dehydrase protein [Colletotrichum incanum]
MEAIRQRIQIPDSIKQIPDQLKPKSPKALDKGSDSIPTSLTPTPVSPPLATPSHGDLGAVLTIACATPIAAKPTTVLATVLNPATYPTWNTFVPRATISRPSGLAVPPMLAGETSVAKLQPGELLLEGTHVTFEVHITLDPAKTTTKQALVVTKLEEFTRAAASANGEAHRGRKGYRVCWKTGGLVPPFVLKSERVQEFLETEDGNGTEYRCWETFYGPLAQVLRFTMVGQLETGFAAWMDGLKNHLEGRTVPDPAAAAAAAAAVAAPATAPAPAPAVAAAS